MPVVPPEGGMSWSSVVLVAWWGLGRSNVGTRNLRLRTIVSAIEAAPVGGSTMQVGRSRAGRISARRAPHVPCA